MEGRSVASLQSRGQARHRPGLGQDQGDPQGVNEFMQSRQRAPAAKVALKALRDLDFWGRMRPHDSQPLSAMPAPAENLSLDQIEAGRKIVLRAFCGNRELRSRLMLLGLFVGAAADVVQTRKRGPTLIRVRNTLVAIGYEEARTILVDVSI